MPTEQSESEAERVTVEVDTMLEHEYEDGSALVDLMGTETIIPPEKWERFNGGSENGN